MSSSAPTESAGDSYQSVVPADKGQYMALDEDAPNKTEDGLWIKPARSLTELFSAPYSIVQLIICVLINFGVNFGLEWATVSQWGKLKQPEFGEIYVIKWNTLYNTSITLDFLLTGFLLPFFLTLFGDGGIYNDMKQRKIPMLQASVYEEWASVFRFLPMWPYNLFLRSIVAGIWSFFILCLPVYLIIFAALGMHGSVNGALYCWIKGTWAIFAVFPLWTAMMLSRVDERRNQDLTFDSMLQNGEADGADIPLVGRVGKV